MVVVALCIALIWGNERAAGPIISRVNGKSHPQGGGGLSQSQSLSPLSADMNIKRPQHPQTPEQIASFLRYSLAPRRGVLLCVSFFTQRNASSPVDTTHVYEDPSDAPNTSFKVLLARLGDSVFSHRRSARPRGCTAISGWCVTQILTGPHRRRGLHFVFPFAQRITSSVVDTTHTTRIHPRREVLCQKHFVPISSISYSPRGALLAHEVASPSQGGAQLDAADIRMSSPKTAPGPPFRPRLEKPILAPA